MITANPNPAAHAGEAQASNSLAVQQAHWERAESELIRQCGTHSARHVIQAIFAASPAVIGGAQ